MNNDKTRKPKKSYIPTLITTIIVCCIFVFTLIYYYMHTFINDGTLNEVSDGNIVYQVENAEIIDNTLHLSGWCCYLDADLSSEKKLPKMRAILIPTDDYNDFIYFDVNNGIERPEIDAYYQEENEKTNCGFDSMIDLNSLNILEHNYEIVLQPDNRRDGLIRPGLFIYQGKLSPIENIFIEPDVEGTDLEDIVRNGIIRAYNPDIGMYLYQYDWKLYFIADEKYPFDEGWLFYGFNVYTNHSELLPEKRQDFSFEPLGWNLLDYEITDFINTGNYRVSVREIPTEYPVIFIETGYYSHEDGWVIKYRICPGIVDNLE